MLDWVFFASVIIAALLIFNPISMAMHVLILREIISIFSLKIKTYGNLQKLLEIEGEMLGLGGKDIRASFTAPVPFSEADSQKMRGNFYLIRCLSSSSGTVVAHELYHVYDGALDDIETSRIMDLIKYLYWYEPRAIFYEFRRLKACNRILKQAS